MTDPNVRKSETGVDISGTGTLLTLSSGVRGRDSAGWQVRGDAAADYRIDIKIDGVWFEGVASYSSTQTVNDGQSLPEADEIRIELTSAAGAGDTADVAAGVTR